MEEKNLLVATKSRIHKQSNKGKSHKIYADPEEEYKKYVEKFSDSRFFSRLINGRRIKPCGRECREQGYLIAANWHHSSFVNFKELMNDEEFILSAAEITPNPVECGNYFYMYVNSYLKQKPEFRLNFLKAVYNNLNVFKLEDINLIVKELNLTKENETILNDLDFKHQMKKKFDKILKKYELEYHCSGQDKKELRRYKIKANEIKVFLENVQKGLKDVINSFVVGDKIDELDFEPSSFYDYLCQQSLTTSKSVEKTTSNEHNSNFEDNYNEEPATYYEFISRYNKKNNGRTF